MSVVTPERAAAFAVLRRTFEKDEYTEVAFRDEVATRGLDPRRRAGAQQLAYGAVQRRGTSDAIVGGYSKDPRKRPDPEAMAALRLGLFELLFAEGGADHASVDQAVSLTREAGAGHAAGFVNAMLRRALRERDSLKRRLADDSDPKAAAFAHSAPLWLVRLWWEELGPERARTVLSAANAPAERALRINPDRITVEEAIERLSDESLELTPAEGPWPMAPPELIIARGNLAAAEAAATEGLVVMQVTRICSSGRGTGSAAWGEGARPLRRSGHQDRPDRLKGRPSGQHGCGRDQRRPGRAGGLSGRAARLPPRTCR